MIQPIIFSAIDLHTLQKSIVQATGFSTQTEQSNLIIQFVQTLVQVKTKARHSKYVALKEAGTLLRCAFFGFITICDETTFSMLAADSNLTLQILDENTNNERFILITGTLYDWRQCIIDSCTVHADDITRDFICQFYNYFDKIGLSMIFSEYRRRPKKGSFYLEHKK